MEGKQSKVAQDLKWVLAQDLKWIDGQDSDLDQDKGTSSQHGEATKDTAEEQYKGDQNPSTTANKMIGGEHGKQGSQSSYPTKEEYIHVRARGVYAKNSHSLAERVRREKISERMKILKDLVPGCSKITGKALILDEITDYVQSLQRQVEFLSMHQAKLIQLLDSTNKQLLAKDMHEAWIIQAGHCDGQLDSDIDQAKEALPQHGESTKDTDEVQQKEDQNPSTTANKDIGEHGKQESEASDHTKEVHIHVGARTGHATERERRDKISTRMKILQDLVPGCSKIVGKVPMLDEIINYVQSLQRQVKFLSMQLATINQKVVPNTKQLLAKDMHKSRIIQAGHCDGQLVRNIFVLAIPIATVLMAYYNPGSLPLAGRFAAVALSVGAAVIWNNILLRKAQPNASIASELLGLSLMLIAFFGYLGSHMPEGYLWLPVLCLVVCLAPLGLALFGCKESNASEIGGGHELVPAALCLV